MEYSYHYRAERTERDNYINTVGIGEVVYSRVMLDEKRGRYFIYEITSTAIVIVKATDRPDYIITKYPARPSRIQKIWDNPSPEVLKISINYSKMGITF